MYSCFQAHMPTAGGSAIFGSLLPSRAKTPFISSFVFPSQDFVQHEAPKTTMPFLAIMKPLVMPQFICTF